MSSKKSLLLLAILAIVFASCEKSDQEETTHWGKEIFYKDFLWKKHTPDTLYRDIAFDFNDDAKTFMKQPLQLALYKKSESGKMVPVKDDEMEVFVDGTKCANNIISVTSNTETLKVGIVVNPQAENKVHHWFFKPVNDAGLERINDLDADTFHADDSSLLEVEVQKKRIMNPLAEGTMFTGIGLVGLLILWLLVLKPIVFPTFRVSRAVLNDPAPYMSQKNIRRTRKFVLSNKKNNQSALNKLFTGTIIYDVNPMWTSDIVIEPRDRNSVRIRANADYMIDARILKANQEYTIHNLTTGTKTKIKLS